MNTEQSYLVFRKQVNVALRHAPLTAYAVNAFHQHHVHLTVKDCLRHFLQNRAIQGQTAAVFVGCADDGISCLFRITA